MFHLYCTCGAHLALLTEEIARRSKCPKCGTPLAQAMGAAQPVQQAAPSGASGATPAPPAPSPHGLKPGSTGPRIVLPPRQPQRQTGPQPASRPASEGPKIRIRKSDMPQAPPKVSLPILDAPPPASAESSTEASTPAPEPSAEPPPAPTPPAPPAAPAKRPPVAPAPKVSIAKEPEATHRRSAAEGVPCAVHPDKQATQNCMNCAKPICIDCIRERGYYCSDQCKRVVSARQPRAHVNTEEIEGVDEKVGSVADKVFKYLKIAIVLLVVGAFGVFGFVIYKTVVKPEGTVAVSTSVSSDMEAFQVRLLDPERIIAQANDALFCARLRTEEKIWSVDLSKLEEKVPGADAPIPATATRAERAQALKASRDRLHFVGVHGNYAIVRSNRQLLVFHTKDGSLKWKKFDPNAPIQGLTLHDSGVLCVQGGRIVSYRYEDGAEAWAVPNPSPSITEPLAVGGNAALLARSEAGSAPPVIRKSSSKPKKVVPGDDEIASLEVGSEELPEVSVPDGSYRLLLYSLANGGLVGQRNFQFGGNGKIVQAGGFLFVTSGPKLSVFEKGAEPLWEKDLPADLIDANSELVVVKSGQNVIAFEARTGQERWRYTARPAESLTLGPGNHVYITVKVTRDEVMQGEWAKYPKATISEVAFNMPGEPLLTLLQLDGKTGEPRWGYKNIGRDLRFTEKDIYCFDQIGRFGIIGGSPLGGGGAYRVTCLSPKDGKERWFYGKEGDMYFYDQIGKAVLLVSSEEVPLSPLAAVGNYQIQIIEE